MPRKLALVLESLGVPFRQAAPLAAKAGYAGALLAARGAFAPQQLSQTGRREVCHLLRTHRLELAALAAPLDRGLDELPELDRRLAYLKETMQLAYDLGPRLVVLAAGAVPAEPTAPEFLLMSETLRDLARHADRVGVRLALEAGLEPPERLGAFLASFGSGSLGVNLDPATLLTNGVDPAGAVRAFAGSLLLVNARDARPRRLDRSAPETSLGGGDVDWLAFLGALEEVAYGGWLAVKRAPTADPVGEAERACRFLKTLGA